LRKKKENSIVVRLRKQKKKVLEELSDIKAYKNKNKNKRIKSRKSEFNLFYLKQHIQKN